MGGATPAKHGIRRAVGDLGYDREGRLICDRRFESDPIPPHVRNSLLPGKF
jgi:hypothetical protein